MSIKDRAVRSRQAGGRCWALVRHNGAASLASSGNPVRLNLSFCRAALIFCAVSIVSLPSVQAASDDIIFAATLTPDPFYSAFHDSHPPAAVRIERLKLV